MCIPKAHRRSLICTVLRVSGADTATDIVLDFDEISVRLRTPIPLNADKDTRGPSEFGSAVTWLQERCARTVVSPGRIFEADGSFSAA